MLVTLPVTPNPILSRACRNSVRRDGWFTNLSAATLVAGLRNLQLREVRGRRIPYRRLRTPRGSALRTGFVFRLGCALLHRRIALRRSTYLERACLQHRGPPSAIRPV